MRIPVLSLLLCGLALSLPAAERDYAVIVSRATQADPKWRAVVKALEKQHHARTFSYVTNVTEAAAELRKLRPRYACFVARPQEAGRELVGAIHQLTRRLDEDPYTDVFWGILTGYDAANALCIATPAEALTIHKVAAGTDIALEFCDEGVWFCELNAGLVVRKAKGGSAVRTNGPTDSTASIVAMLNDYQPDLFATSGHATERDWQIGFRYRNGSFRCANGQLFGLDTQGNRWPVASPNPKVYMPIGNCLMGHIDGRDAMALAWLNSAGVRQMFGYIQPTWYGYSGWGCLDYFVEQPGRYTFTEAFFANQIALQHRLQKFFPSLTETRANANGTPSSPVQLTDAARAAKLTANDARGLLFDRDVVAFYGDPAWVARMAPAQCAWDQLLTEQRGVFTFEVTPRRGAGSFKPANTNGSQRGGRPIIQFLPRRLRDIRILEGAELKPLITENFLLLDEPEQTIGDQPRRLRFSGTNQ